MAGGFGRLPSMRAVQALEALDRLGSAARVAEEMALTRSAVSHMLRRLEAEAGFALSEPYGRGVRLTPRGRRYAGEVRRALQIMAAAATSEGPALSGDLKLVCPPGLGTFWLSERIGGFAAAYPGLRLSIAASHALSDIADESPDVQIAFGDDMAMDGRAELLARVSLFPICAAAIPGKTHAPSNPIDLEHSHLLHLITHVDWERWLAAAGINTVDPRTGTVFSAMPMVQMAAVAGQGVALGDSLTARRALEQGQLIRPFELSIPSRWSYFIRVKEDGPAPEAATALAAWIRAEITGDQTSA